MIEFDEVSDDIYKLLYLLSEAHAWGKKNKWPILRIPSQSFHRFRRKLFTDSEPNFPGIPRQAFQRFRRKLSSLQRNAAGLLTSQ